MNLPALARVPSINHDLTIKASANGIVFLTTSRFTTRYTGNKYSYVDINGNLWVKKTDFLKSQKREVKPKKKPQHKNTGGEKDLINEIQSNDNISTSTPQLSTQKGVLSTKKEYRVNGPEVRNRLLAYINTQAGKKELYFWTITFPEKMPDSQAYRLFNIWLTSLRQYRMLKNYLWVAERQKNGTIHFHVAIPHKMSVKRANAMMRGTLVNAAKKNEIPFNQHLMKKYNGVDIAKNRKTKRVTNFAVKKGSKALTNYLTKYVTKNTETFSHLAWHNSRGFSSLFLGVTFTIEEFKNFGFHENLHNKQLKSDHFIFIPWHKDKGPPDLIMDHLYKLNSFIQSQLNNN